MKAYFKHVNCIKELFNELFYIKDILNVIF